MQKIKRLEDVLVGICHRVTRRYPFPSKYTRCYRAHLSHLVVWAIAVHGIYESPFICCSLVP